MSDRKIQGFSVALFPTSWAFGPWSLPHKWLFAVGPFRIVWHKNVIGKYGTRAALAPEQEK